MKHTEKKNNIRNEQILSVLWDGLEQSITYVSEQVRKIVQDNGQFFSKFVDAYWSIDPRSAMNLKYKKPEKNYTKAYHNKMSPNQG